MKRRLPIPSLAISWLGWECQEHLVLFATNHSVLYSRHILPLPLEGSSSASAVSSSTPSSILLTTTTITELSFCAKPYWTTYCYYSSGDRRLGDMIHDLAKDLNLPCERPGCLFTCRQHEIRIIHEGTSDPD